MEKMKYRISSRATILIGRESVSRADGAVIELIKNTYDADADFCYIAFDSNNDRIFILDNGVGMTRNVIENAWMLIGTDNKKINILSEGKRVRSGEKGIGRFALDRLGSQCTMYTKSRTEKLIYWSNNWDKFEEAGKTLDEIEADFSYLDYEFKDIIPSFMRQNIFNAKNRDGERYPEFDLSTGTLFVISGLRDQWTDSETNKILSVLGYLVPPAEQTKYYIFLQKSPDDEFVEVECETTEDFDYRVKAKFDGENIIAKVERNEFDFKLMPKDLFLTEAFQKEPYTIQTFSKGEFVVNQTLSEATKITNEEFLRKAKEVGPFEFQYVFLKLGGGEGKYYYKPVNPNRRVWIEEHGGIKIYRDNFIVRPYGDPKSKSYDWLGLDARKGMNPTPIAHSSENWHVNNFQMQGTIMISRLENSSILDKSSREGIIENEYFEVLIKIILSMISIFEKDRAHIVANIKKYWDNKNERNETKAKALGIAKEVLGGRKKKGQDDAKEKLAKAVKIYEEEREDLISEIKLLRALATNGLMTTAMVHDLKTINSLLVSRVNGFRIAIKHNDADLIKRNLLDLRLNDEFLKSWITVITNQSNRDRRKRLKKDISKTVETAVELLKPILDRKQVALNIFSDKNTAFKKIFETDFDSIIYNLVINSIESFEASNCIDRRIEIKLEVDEKFVIHYLDNGHGLSDAFLSNPYSIFDYGTTSKYDSDGNQVGTGLGMYIVASTINEYNGTYTLTKIENGFGLDIKIPI